jgi:hypothetical protein
MIKDPRTKQFCENGDTFNGWIGPDVHFLFSTIKNGSDCCWVLTHRVSHIAVFFFSRSEFVLTHRETG